MSPSGYGTCFGYRISEVRVLSFRQRLLTCVIYGGMEKKILCELIEGGATLKQIAVTTNTSQTNVRYWLKKFELKLKRGSKGKKPKDFSFPRKCSCGETDVTKFYGNKTTVCAKCHSKYTLSKGQDNRKYMIAKLGGKCINCNFDRDNLIFING